MSNLETTVQWLTEEAIRNGDKDVHALIMKKVWRGLVRGALLQCGTQTLSAQVLGVNRGTFRKHVKEHVPGGRK